MGSDTKRNLRPAVQGRETNLGRRVSDFEGFDVFDAHPANKCVEYYSKEVTSTCPVTGQPDFYEVSITILEPVTLIESKTMKLYLQSFRHTDGEFCEAMSGSICEAVHEATQATKCIVEVSQVPRGGVGIIARSEMPND